MTTDIDKIMKEKLGQLFNFLQENRIYNKTLQEKYYRSIIKPFDNVTDKMISLLYHIANTQSQPKIDKLAEFYKEIYLDINCLSSFKSFIVKVNPDNEINYKSLYYGMKSQHGWGQKTSALFLKSIFHIHNGQYSDELKIWSDVPSEIDKTDDFYLPVDIVITAIFKKLDKKLNWNFDNINSTIKKYYNGHEIEVWDDLWFWGFITQHGSGDNRQFVWNFNKYWALKETDKDPIKIDEIKNKAELFINILEKD
jgi:hypothetical protein